jgi:hypothetical protein
MRLVRQILLLSVLVLALAAGCSGEEDSGPSADASFATSDAGPGQLPYMAECTQNEQCETELCFNFNNKGPHCTHECQTAGDCEAPSPGCNGMGVCKAP